MKKKITLIVIGILLIICSNTIFTIFYSEGAYTEVFKITKILSIMLTGLVFSLLGLLFPFKENEK
ncbi:hypothetical protein [Clostridium sardiniense]|uniref:hypothetical protein n=1 Tax=Clostridium sardiniense TaxID=29369 RepID=UPI003D3304E2